MSVFPHLPLGRRIPGSPHSVSFSLPTIRAVRGYEEKDPEVVGQLSSGYPRFVVHPSTRELAAHFLAAMPEPESGSPPRAGARVLWLATSAQMAIALTRHLGPASGAHLFSRDGLHGVAHPDNAETSAQAKLFLQHTGGFLSSREAEDHLVRLGLQTSPYAEPTFAGDAAGEVRRHLRRELPGTSDADIFLAPSGMNAIWAAFNAAAGWQASRGRTVWLQLGWLYLDTIAILRKFTATPADYVYIRDVFDFATLERIFARHGPRIAGVIAEVPTNPLIQTPDLPALAALCRQHDALLIADPSVSSIYSVEVLPHADIVVASLTKYTASEGDLTAGLAAVNPTRPHAAELRQRLPAALEPVYPRDLARLAAQIGETPNVLARIHANTAEVAAFLASHPAVAEVFWALHPAAAANYRRLARSPAATGSMITFTLKRLGVLDQFYDHLRLPKGPSFGMKTTLVCPFMYLAHYDLVSTSAGMAELAASRLDPDLVRLSCGIEPADEIVAALAEALDYCK